MNLIKKSIKAIKESQLKNGGILAGPKKSAYPYVYPRDAVIMTKALNRTGNHQNSEKFFYFMKEITKISQYGEVFHRYNLNGWPCVTRKDQNDNEGLVLQGIYDTYLHNKRETFLEEMWSLVEEIAKLIISYSRTGLVKTKRSIHEFYRLESGYDIWVNCACWKGMMDASEIAEIIGRSQRSKEWRMFSDKLKKNIQNKMFDKKLKVFMKNPRLKGIPDISQLAPFYFDFVEDKILLRTTMKYLREHLWHREIGGFRRFRKFDVVEDWHWYTGGSGSWSVFTAWGAKFYKKLGNKSKYDECLNWLKETASRTSGLFPEHVSTRQEYEDWKAHEIEFNQRLVNGTIEAEKLASGFGKDKNKLIYWATPLGWAHAEYILLEKER